MPCLINYTILVYSIRMEQMELFCECPVERLPESARFCQGNVVYNFNESPALAALLELSADAYSAALYASMSELPIKGEISRFIEKVTKAGNRAGSPSSIEAREAACQAASDRGDPDVLTVLRTQSRVTHEIHRLTGLLRFSPDPRGVYIARCSPDFFILPALAEHFRLRFGATPWAIIDEKRSLCLAGEDGQEPLLSRTTCGTDTFNSGEPGSDIPEQVSKDSWEDLWRLYHRSINNESRRNPRLQGQFMPERYRKYLPELQ